MKIHDGKISIGATRLGQTRVRQSLLSSLLQLSSSLPLLSSSSSNSKRHFIILLSIFLPNSKDDLQSGFCLSLKQSLSKGHPRLAMEQALGKNDGSSNGANMKVPLRNMNNVIIKPNKCNQCDFTSSWAGNLRTHLKTHSGEKSNKCNQCDFTSSEAGDLRRHLKTHSGKKTHKCNQCDYVSSQ